MVGQVEKKEQRIAKFVLCEAGVPAYPLKDFEGNVSYPEDGTVEFEGMSVYEGTEKFAVHMVMNGGKVTSEKDASGKLVFVFKPGRYYLIGSKGLDAQWRDPKGAITWIRINPYQRMKQTKQAMNDGEPVKDAAGKPVYNTYYTWEEIKGKK